MIKITALAALLTLGLAGQGRSMSIVANTFFTTGGNALNWVDAVGGSASAPRTFVNTQAIGLTFPWLSGPTSFGFFYSRTAFDSGFGGPVTIQAMGTSFERPVFMNTSFGIRGGDGIVNGPGVTNAPAVLFEFYTRIPLGFSGVFLEIVHQVIVSLHGTSTNNTVFNANHVGVSIGGGSK